MLILYSLFISVMDTPIPILKEPVPPLESSLSLNARCANGTTIQINDVGSVGTDAPEPTILVDGRVPDGEEVAAIKRDLSDPSAVYRLIVRCSQEVPGFSLLIYAGKQSDKEIGYKVGHARIVAGTIKFYNRLSPTNEAGFWFE